jgi:hypothetical protein
MVATGIEPHSIVRQDAIAWINIEGLDIFGTAAVIGAGIPLAETEPAKVAVVPAIASSRTR